VSQTPPAADLDLAYVDEAIARHGRKSEATIPLLQALQEHYRYLPQAALERLVERTEITASQIAGVASFYSQFRHRPMGRHLVRVCVGTACHVAGAGAVYDAFREHLGIEGEADTDRARRFTVEKVACLGCCTLAPVVQIDEVTYGYLNKQRVAEVVGDFLALEAGRARRRPGRRAAGRAADLAEIRVGVDSTDIARGSAKVMAALEEAVVEAGAPARVKAVGSLGMAYLTPLVEVVPPGQHHGTIYAGVRPEAAWALVLRHFRPRSLAGRARAAASHLLDQVLTDETWTPIVRSEITVRDPHVAPFAGRQVRISTEHAGHLDPTDLAEYEARDGFRMLRRCVTDLPPDRVIEEIGRSGLRGRGGGGYPSARKWAQVRAASGDKKYVVCNGDEGDPGAFMDRMILESYPYRVIEGAAIAARAVGADEGYLYIRAEYPLAVRRVNEALEQCRRRGLLGRRILGSDFDFDLHVMRGAGAFVCGEETALLASIEGRRGMPRFRPPYPAERGLWGRPTLVSNVETLATVPWVLRNGAEAFAALGTATSKGTKVFALAGKVLRGGLIEVPMGITIREIVEDIGGGIAGGKRFKAVQIGGPSGGCIPAELADTPVDYEALERMGAMMGSGGLVVLSEDDCMVEIARYFLEFTQDQSCGRCTFCRVGTRRMLEILTGLCEGRGKKGDIEELEALAHLIKKGSLCGLGKTAPNPVLTTIRYFRQEYEAHLEKRCPAARCKALIKYTISDDCIGCTLCAQQCPADAIPAKPYEQHEIDQTKCVKCGTCKAVCPVEAVGVE
jgi:NADH-quinone oxidoreductase subunit F